MQRRYGSTEFSKLTGISRTSLQRMKVAGELPGNLNETTNKLYYLYNDFNNEYVVSKMRRSGKKLPKTLIDEILQAVMSGAAYEAKSPGPKFKENFVEPVAKKSVASKLKLVDKQSVVKKSTQVTTYYDLEQLPEGLLKEIIPPVEGLDYIGQSTWIITIKTLIEQGTFKVADITSLIMYCQTADQLEAYKKDTVYFVDQLGKINPLLSEIKTCKATIRGIAKDLHLTPDSRKHIKSAGDQDVDENTAGWMEVVK